ncbi:hypothetical protein PIB30_048235 [Stylosanthes scabra]|uniref:Uncharacterized protein n=1 Tax=Stylosanthes scabra TaxID=79078 RepID=A0ABU6WHD0_9FABA|nr:hypothetical protein [Stylosanthes scabra]
MLRRSESFKVIVHEGSVIDTWLARSLVRLSKCRQIRGELVFTTTLTSSTDGNYRRPPRCGPYRRPSRRKPPSSPNVRLSLFPHSLSLSLSSISPSSDLRSEFRHHHCTRGTELAEAASGAACGWGSSEFVRFRRCSYLSRHFGWFGLGGYNASNDDPGKNIWDHNVLRYESMVADAFPQFDPIEEDDEREEHHDPNPDAIRFYQLLESVRKPLWEGSVFSQVSIVTRMLAIKSENN